MWNRDIVRGTDEVEVTTLGFFAGSMDEVFEGDTHAQELAARFQNRRNLGSGLFIVGAAIFGLSAFADHPSLPSGTNLGIAIGGFAISIAGGVVWQSGEESLSQAIWEYNSNFALNRPGVIRD